MESRRVRVDAELFPDGRDADRLSRILHGPQHVVATLRAHGRVLWHVPLPSDRAPSLHKERLWKRMPPPQASGGTMPARRK